MGTSDRHADNGVDASVANFHFEPGPPRRPDSGGSTPSQISRNAWMVGAVFLVIASGALEAGWDAIPSGSITVESVAPSNLISGAGGAWVLYVPTLSVDCSPPRVAMQRRSESTTTSTARRDTQ